MREPLLELKGVSKRFTAGAGRKNLVLSDIDLSICRGETLGIVGESGCGKSTLARVIMGVFPPTSGELFYNGNKLSLGRQKERKKFAQHVQMIFQDPYTSLDPRMTVESILSENMEIHGTMDRMKRKQRVLELLEMTGLSQDHAGRFPHEFSGGQRQRIGIARSLAVQPELLICDEPISALDISIQSQIMNLLIRLKEELGLTYLFIAHDLNMVRYISDRIAVMYAGRIVETGEAKEVYDKPQHPYTRMLLQAVLPLVPGEARLEALGRAGNDTLGHRTGKGCPYAGRCPEATNLCQEKTPALAEVGGNHMAACFAIEGKG